MIKLIRSNLIELLMIVLAFIDLFLHVIPPAPLAGICLVLLFFRLKIVDIILICLYAAPKLSGAIFLSYNLSGVGGALILISPLLVVYGCFITKKLAFLNMGNVIPAFLLFFGYLFVSVLFLGNDSSFSKLLNTIINSIFAILVYTAVFSNYKKCDFIKTGLYFILIAFLLLLLSPIFNKGSGPSGIFDFGYLRMQNGEWGDLEVSGIISYQQVGSVAVLGFGTIMLEELKGRINTLFLFIVLLISTVASLYAGARQFLVISVLLVVVWTVFEKKESAAKILIPFFSIILLFLVAYFLFSSGGMMNNVLTDGYLEASKRGNHIEQGIDDFNSSPLFGIGYGCFMLNGVPGGYPHNLFIELLAELGIIGLLFFWIPLLRPMVSIITKMRPCLYIMIIYFLRSMTSGGIDTNIILFVYILAAYSCFSYRPSKHLTKKISL